MFKIVQRGKNTEAGSEEQQSPSPCRKDIELLSKPVGTPNLAIRKPKFSAKIVEQQLLKTTVDPIKIAKQQQLAPSVATTLPTTSAVKEMEASVQLIADQLELLDTIKEFLYKDNKKFTVIGAIGSHGTGKSTILSMLAGNDPMDMYRQYVFRPCAREAVEACRYQTTKISIYVFYKTRTFFLDCQPMNCAPLIEDRSHSYRSKAGPLESVELETLQFLLLLANICHTLILCVDWFIDLNIVRRMMRVELFPSFLQAKESEVNLVIVHQRAKSQDFQPLLYEERMNILDGIFCDTIFNVHGGLTMAKLGFIAYEQVKSDVNYVVMGELKPRTRADMHPTPDKSKEIDYEKVIASLRLKICGLPKRSKHGNDMTEDKWFSHLINCWNKIKDELPLITEDGCTIRRQHKLPNTISKMSENPLQNTQHQQQQEFQEKYATDMQGIYGIGRISIGDQQQKRNKRNFVPQQREWKSRNAMGAGMGQKNKDHSKEAEE